MNIPFLRRRRGAPAIAPHEHHRTWREAALWLDYPRMRVRHPVVEPEPPATGVSPRDDTGTSPDPGTRPEFAAGRGESTTGAQP